MHATLKNRYVAFLDVLGFSERLASTSLDVLHAEYSALIDEARTKVFDAKDSSDQPNNNFAWARFVFDSLIVVSNETEGENGPLSAFKFIAALSHLMELSFERRLPLRGCVGFGDVLDDSQRSIVLSPAFVDLIRSERSFNWSGAVVLTEASEHLAAILGAVTDPSLAPDASRLLLRYPAPKKKESSADQDWCVNWVHFMSDDALDRDLSFLNGVKGPPTRAFIDFVRGLPYQRQELPQRFRPSTHIRFMFGGGGMRMKFCDDRGNPKAPPDGTTIEIRLLVSGHSGGEAG